MTTTWKVDQSHSEIEFKARHLMISNVTGNFTSFEGTVETDGDDFEKAKIAFSADVDSIDTGDEKRDAHLKSDDFFSAEKFPKLTFESTKIDRTSDDDRYIVSGDLAIRGVTKSVKLDVTTSGMVKDPWGNTRAGFELSTKVNRKEFGLIWNALTEAGGMLVGDEIRIHCEVELVKEVAVPA